MNRLKTPFSIFNRAQATRKLGEGLPAGESLLSVFAAAESLFLTWFVQLAEADGTTYS